VRVWVTDNGIGIPLSNTIGIFQLFGRIHPESLYPGTGLGLAIVKKAIARMGGENRIQIRAVGAAANFWFILANGDH